jgi:cold shock protein
VLSVHSSIVARVAPRRSSAIPDSPPPDIGVEETGTVKWFNPERGYGFIARDSGGKDVFVHVSALERSGISTLDEGQEVIVDVVEGRKGLEAARVRLV